MHTHRVENARGTCTCSYRMYNTSLVTTPFWNQAERRGHEASIIHVHVPLNIIAYVGSIIHECGWGKNPT